MNDTGIRPEVIEEIRNLAQKYDIEKVILFGSRARGDFRRTSDIDIAVTGGDFARFALDVDEETSTLLEYDIVNLDRDMQDELRESISNFIIFCCVSLRSVLHATSDVSPMLLRCFSDASPMFSFSFIIGNELRNSSTRNILSNS